VGKYACKLNLIQQRMENILFGAEKIGGLNEEYIESSCYIDTGIGCAGFKLIPDLNSPGSSRIQLSVGTVSAG